MAGLENCAMYLRDASDNWEQPHIRNAQSTRMRPTDLNLHTIIPPAKVPEECPSDETEDIITRHVGMSVGLATLVTENLLSHPFVVLRRQCQVHPNSRKNHLLAVTLIPVIVRLHKRQGLTTLWKGLGSSLLVRGMTLAVEDLISKLTPWPKELKWHGSFKSIGQHILLKCVSFAIMTPFYSASLVETVQSDIASEKPGIFDVFKDGMCRLVSWGSPQKGRMLPVWALVVPTVFYGLLKYFFSVVIQHAASFIIQTRKKNNQIKKGALHKDILSQSSNQDVETASAFIGMVTADVICYPFETILHRLHLQGTRTIVDNLDSGAEVIPILTNYQGAGDCYESTITQEGITGLYKGFGALILQFAAHWAVVKLTKVLVTEISILLRSNAKAKQPEPEIDHRNLVSVPSRVITPRMNPEEYPGTPIYTSDFVANIPH